MFPTTDVQTQQAQTQPLPRAHPIEVCTSSGKGRKPTLNTLRDDSNFRQVSQEIVGQVWSSDTDSSEGQLNQSSNKGKRKSLKSGMAVTSSSSVKVQLKWPHSQLQYHYVTQSLGYSDLNLPLLVAGELEIITNCTSEVERSGRLNLLKILSYEANTYAFKVISDWYAAYIRAIEMGRANWGTSPYVAGQAILARHRPVEKGVEKTEVGKKGKVLRGQENKSIFFCANFNRNKCSKSAPHDSTVRGKSVQVLHICAACWLKSASKVHHAESSADCPLFKDNE